MNTNADEKDHPSNQTINLSKTLLEQKHTAHQKLCTYNVHYYGIKCERNNVSVIFHILTKRTNLIHNNL